MVQLSYDPSMAIAQAGQPVDSRPILIVSRAAEGTIPFGKALMDGTSVGKQVKVMTDKTKAFRGIALFSHEKHTPRTGDSAYEDKDAISVVRKGYVYVPVTEAVAAGDRAYVDCSNADATKRGSFCKTATNNVDTGTTFCTAAKAGGFAGLEINLDGMPQALEHTPAPTTPAPTTAPPTTLPG